MADGCCDSHHAGAREGLIVELLAAFRHHVLDQWRYRIEHKLVVCSLEGNVPGPIRQPRQHQLLEPFTLCRVAGHGLLIGFEGTRDLRVKLRKCEGARV